MKKCCRGKPVRLRDRTVFQHAGAGDILLGDHINNEDELNNVNIKIM